jgi:spore maturation protein CgeB
MYYEVERNEIAINGYNSTKREHSYENRIKNILDIVNSK